MIDHPQSVRRRGHLVLKTIVGVSMTDIISGKIMKIIKTEKVSKIPKNNNFFTCLLLFRLLVNLPNFEVLSHLNELDLRGLF